MNKYGLFVVANVFLFTLPACMTNQAILYDNRIPISERSERYQEVQASARASDSPATDGSKIKTLICSGDREFNYAWASTKPASAKVETCFLAGQVECETPGLKYRFGAVDWFIGERQGAIAADENGGFFLPIKKSELGEPIAIQVSDVRVVYQNNHALDLKVPEKICLKK